MLFQRSLALPQLSLALVALMWVFPFLYHYHAYPLTTFYQEWWAALLGCGALPLLMTRQYWQQPEIPRIALLPLGLLLLGLLQYLVGKIPYFEQLLLLTFYLLWCTLLMVVGMRLRETFGLPGLVAVLAGALLCGAEINAAIGLVQHFGWSGPWGAWIAAKNAMAVYGNLAQPNHYANYLSLGLVSLGLLLARGHLRAWQAVLFALPLLFVMTLSGARGPWLYLAAMLLLAFLWQRRKPDARGLLYYSLALLAGFVVMQQLVHLAVLSGAGGSVSSAARLFHDEGSGSIRVYLWEEAGRIYSRFPLFGAGFGQYGYQHFLLGPELQQIQINGLYNNAHNLVLQLAAEMGSAGLLVFFGALALWLRQAVQAPRTPEHWWGYAVLAVLGIHSLLEYPLWYAYFVGIAAVTLGVFDATTYRLALRSGARMLFAAIWLLGVFSLLQMQQGYQRLETLLAMRPSAPTDVRYVATVWQGLESIRGPGLLRPYAELFMTSLLDSVQLPQPMRFALNDAALHFIPTSQVAYRQAWLLAWSGREEEARRQIACAIWAYPYDYPAAAAMLEALAAKEPGRFAALQTYARQVHQTWSSEAQRR